MEILATIPKAIGINILKKFIKYSSVISVRHLSTMGLLLPPEQVRGMKVLNREKFKKTIPVPTIKLLNIDIYETVKILKKYLLKMDNFKPVHSVETGDPLLARLFDGVSLQIDICKLVYLNPDIINNWSDIADDDTKALNLIGIEENSLIKEEITLTYDNWKSDEIIRAILPADEETVTGFSIIGHIIHLNLKDHQIDYKYVIGQVLLDKNKNCKTVVNKTNQIDNTYRNFSMETLCGESNFITRAKENKCTFEFDFSKVYWNPRLSTEHERIVNLLQAGDILFDVFAGVGPFAIPAAKKKCIVFANDLNPESYKWLNYNATLNKIKRDKFHAFNKDGRTFINDIFGKFMEANSTEWKNITGKNTIHITMNLPALAVEFLDAFNGVVYDVSDDTTSSCYVPILVHVYSFATGDNPGNIVKKMICEKIGFDIERHINEVVNVRNVAPNKEMIRVSFYLNKKSKESESNIGEKRKSPQTIDGRDPKKSKFSI